MSAAVGFGYQQGNIEAVALNNSRERFIGDDSHHFCHLPFMFLREHDDTGNQQQQGSGHGRQEIHTTIHRLKYSIFLIEDLDQKSQH